jgi:hypothetical protein
MPPFNHAFAGWRNGIGEWFTWGLHQPGQQAPKGSHHSSRLAVMVLPLSRGILHLHELIKLATFPPCLRKMDPKPRGLPNG